MENQSKLGETVHWAGNREPREVMDVRQAAFYLGIATDTLYKYAQEGAVPAFRLGNRWKFKKSLLDEWMAEQSRRGQ
jgi:excisionase family DNA binding protein